MAYWHNSPPCPNCRESERKVDKARKEVDELEQHIFELQAKYDRLRNEAAHVLSHHGDHDAKECACFQLLEMAMK